MSTIASHEQDDQIIERFETEWSPMATGPTHVLSFIRKFGDSLLGRPSLMSDLIQIDIERAWQSWCKQTKTWVNGRTADLVRKEFLLLPRLEHYFELFPLVRQDRQVLSDCCNFESQVRATFGDAIGPLYYQQRYGIEIGRFDRPVARRIKFVPARVILEESHPDFVLHGLTIMGRQRSKEATDHMVETRVDGSRVVIAPHDELRISREHLEIQLVSPYCVIMTNISHINAMPLATPSILLEPHQSVSLQFPIMILLPSEQIVLA